MQFLTSGLVFSKTTRHESTVSVLSSVMIVSKAKVLYENPAINAIEIPETTFLHPCRGSDVPGLMSSALCCCALSEAGVLQPARSHFRRKPASESVWCCRYIKFFSFVRGPSESK